MKQYQIKPELDIRQREVILEDKKIIYINMIGDYKKNNYAMAWKKLWEYAQTENISINKEFICIYHDDPKVTQPERQRTDVCLSYNGEAKPKGEISVKRIEAGKYIAFLYKGPYDNLSKVYDTIYGKKFPESGYEMALKPGFELYINDPSCTLPENLLTEIYVPII
jgi:DNA gyrase inhibitor